MKLFDNLSVAFDRFDDTIQSYIQKALNSSGVAYSKSSVYGIIFSGVKGIMQNIMFYIEDALNEQNVFTAYRKKSIYSLAKISGYEPFYGSPASGNIIISLLNNKGRLKNNTSKLIIYNNTNIINRNTNITYMLKLSTSKYVIDLNKPIINKEFSIVQGFQATAQYVAKGINLETIHIESVELFDINSIEVYVDGKKWLRVGTLYDMTEYGEEYIVTIGYDNSFDVMFGNTSYGRLLNEGQVVNINYIKHIGSNGNINVNTSANLIFNDYGYDIYGNTVNLNDYIKINLKNMLSGGINADSIDFLKKNIGLNSRSNVLVSDDNFKLFLKRFSFIGQSNVYVDINSMKVICVAIKNFNNIINSLNDLYTVSNSDYLLTDNEKQIVIDTLYNSKKMFAGLSFEFEDPILRKYAIQCFVKISDKYNKDTIEEQIKTIIFDYFNTNSNDVTFIAKSTLINLVLNNVSNIDSLSLNIISEFNEQAYFNKKYTKYNIEQSKNDSITYNKEEIYYTAGSHCGLDDFGNIKVDSKLEIPILGGPIRYYYNKDNEKNNFSSSVLINPIEVYFTT